MGKTAIEWCDYTFNPWWGCEKVSPGCQQCYAESDAKRYGHAVWGKDAPRRFLSDTHWDSPGKWDREAARLGLRYRVFCASMADICEDRPDLTQPRLLLKFLIANTPHLDWLLLTKRPENYLRLFGKDFFEQCPHAWPGTTTENQEQADRRIPNLLKVPGLKWLSIEPMLGPVDLWGARYMLPGGGRGSAFNWGEGVKWVIYGGESGTGARRCNVEWIRAGIQECRGAGAAIFVKQLGSKPVATDGVADHVGTWPLAIKEFKGKDPAEWPEDLRVREWPK